MFTPPAAAGGEPVAALPAAAGMPLARDLGTEMLRARQQFRLYK